MDWKDQLKAFAAANPDLPEGEEPIPEAVDQPKQPRLDISIERKGRAGKTATLISGWIYPDDRLAQIASELKHRLATGGSSRGGDILIQGNRAADCLKALTDMGYKARII